MIGPSILLVGMIGVRELLWWQEMKQLRNQQVVREKIILMAPVRETASNCMTSYRGVEYRMKKENCLEGGWLFTEVGEKLELTGSWKTYVIGNKKTEKSFVEVTKLTIVPGRGKSRISWQRGLSWLYTWRVKLLRMYQQHLPEPEASLIAGIVWGEQATLPDKFADALRKAGLMHVVAASGYNVTVVAGLMLTILTKWWGRQMSALAAIAGIGLYVVLAGASPPVVRAGVMGVMALLALTQGRWYWGLWALGLSSGLMLLLWPWLLISVSFQLSVAATAGMMVLAGTREVGRCQIFHKGKGVWALFGGVISTLQEAFMTTLAAMIATAPIQAATFGEMSWLGLVANPLVLWMIPLLMYQGLAYAFLGLIWHESLGLVTWLIYPVAHIFVVGVTWLNQVPWGNISVNANWAMMTGWWLGWLGWTGQKLQRRLRAG